jgi:hypothetical protein
MIRVYISHNEVVGFGQQLIKALVPPDPAAGSEAAQPGPRIMYPGRSAVPRTARQNGIGIGTQHAGAARCPDDIAAGGCRLPLRSSDDGADTYVLCEINVSSIAPYPDSAAPKVAGAVLLEFATRKSLTTSPEVMPLLGIRKASQDSRPGYGCGRPPQGPTARVGRTAAHRLACWSRSDAANSIPKACARGRL